MVFCNSASLMFMPAEVWGLKQSKNSQNICFGPSKLTCIHGKLFIIFFFFKYLVLYFSFRESSRHKYICLSEMSWNPFFIFIYLHLPTISLDGEVHTSMNNTVYTIIVYTTYVMEKWNCWLADIIFDWHHVMEMAFEHNNHAHGCMTFLCRFIFLFFIEVWTQWVQCKVNDLLFTRPIVYIMKAKYQMASVKALVQADIPMHNLSTNKTLIKKQKCQKMCFSQISSK